MADELSMFDVTTFLDTNFEGAMSTKLILVPAQDWTAVITKLSPKKTVVDGVDRAILSVQWCIEDPKCTAVTKQEKNFVKQDHWLDFKTENNQVLLDFDEGKNISLGALREALGQNKAKGNWQPVMLMNGTALVRVSHRADKNDSSLIYAEVKRVAPLAA